MGSFGGTAVTDEQIQSALNTILGYAVYFDTQYTSASPLVITQDATIPLPNNAGNIIDQLPDGVTTFYDSVTGKIIPDNAFDRLQITLRFLAKTSAANGASVNFGVDIGGTFGIIFPDSRPFIKGANTEQPFNFVMPGYTGATFLANGGLPTITSLGGNTSIYDIELHVERTYKGR